LAHRILETMTSPDRHPGRPVLTPAAEHVLVTYSWPGNLRELRNALERAWLACDGAPIGAAHLVLDRDSSPAMPGSAEAAADSYADFERAHIERVLGEERHHVGRAAERLGIPRSTLYQKLHALGIPTRRTRLTLLERQQEK